MLKRRVERKVNEQVRARRHRFHEAGRCRAAFPCGLEVEREKLRTRGDPSMKLDEHTRRELEEKLSTSDICRLLDLSRRILYGLLVLFDQLRRACPQVDPKTDQAEKDRRNNDRQESAERADRRGLHRP